MPLLQLRILRLGLLQDGNVRVGIFPEGEEVLIRSAGFRGVPLHRVCARQAKPGQRTQWKVSHRAPVIDEFLIFRRRFFASMQPQIGFASYIGGMEGCSKIGREKDGSEFIRGRSLKKVDGFSRVVVIKFDGGANGGEPISADKRVEWVASSQIVAHFLSLRSEERLRPY